MSSPLESMVALPLHYTYSPKVMGLYNNGLGHAVRKTLTRDTNDHPAVFVIQCRQKILRHGGICTCTSLKRAGIIEFKGLTPTGFFLLQDGVLITKNWSVIGIEYPGGNELQSILAFIAKVKTMEGLFYCTTVNGRFGRLHDGC